MSHPMSSKLPPPSDGTPDGKVVPIWRRQRGESNTEPVEPPHYGAAPPSTDRRPADGPMPQELPPPPDAPPGADTPATEDGEVKRTKKRRKGSGDPPDEPRHYRKELTIGFAFVDAIILIVLMVIFPVIFWIMLILAVLAGPSFKIMQVARRIPRVNKKKQLVFERGSRRKMWAVTLNTNGGSAKTVVAVLLIKATILIQQLRAAVNLNHLSGHFGERLGKFYGTAPRFSHLVRVHDNSRALDQLVNDMARHFDDPMLYLDREADPIDAEKFSIETIEAALTALYMKVMCMVMDGSNDTTKPFSIAAARHGVPVFTANAIGMNESLGDVVSSIENLKKKGIDDVESRAIVVVSWAWPWPFQNRNKISGLSENIPVFYLPFCWEVWRARKGRPIRFTKVARSHKKIYEVLLDIVLMIIERMPDDESVSQNIMPKTDENDAWVGYIDQLIVDQGLPAFPPPSTEDTPITPNKGDQP